MLIGLIERLHYQDGSTRRYLLGSMNFELGLSALSNPTFSAPSIRIWNSRPAGTGSIVMRSGADVVLGRVEGVRTLRNNVQIGGAALGFTAGGRHPVSLVGEIAQILQINKRDIDNHARLTSGFRRSVASTRERGYARQDIQTIRIATLAATPLARRRITPPRYDGSQRAKCNAGGQLFT